jgi:ADP-heptose:LPS heptosyltransferase
MGSIWKGPILNLCGVLAPRQSAAALSRALVFVGHDSGPMHLGAAVGIPCVCMFGNYNRPRRWHPYGTQHRVLHNTNSVKEIAPSEVFAAVEALIRIHEPIVA